MARAQFLFSILRQRLGGQSKRCPFCGSSSNKLLARKKMILELRQCDSCSLMYRWPKDLPEGAARYYQEVYHERMVTELPSKAALVALVQNGFQGSDKDLTDKIAILKRFRPEGRLLDFGCSWGYGVYQFQSAGYDACGFEISRPRAAFGRDALAVRILSDWNALDALPAATFDVIFANHVLEHLPQPQLAFRMFERLLAPTGIAMLFVPNCAGFSALQQGVRWGPMIGEKHNLALTARFFSSALPRFHLTPIFQSSPYGPGAMEPISAENHLPGDELLVIATRSA